MRHSVLEPTENPNNRVCILCLRVLRGWRDTKQSTEFACIHCGPYVATDGVVFGLAGGQLKVETADRSRLSWLVRERNNAGLDTIFTVETFPALLREAPVRGDLDEHCDFVLSELGRISKDLPFNASIDLSTDRFPEFRARSAEELGAIFQELIAREYVTGQPPSFRLRTPGLRRLRELRMTGPISSQAFVAMSFRDEVKPVYEFGIKPALEECGFVPLRVDQSPKDAITIDDRILAGIRDSALVVADFTLHRPNVYLEAGFAMGLRIPVIRTIRDEGENTTVHFDQEHYHFFRWKDPEQLRAELVPHIKTNYPRAGR